ncbi:serine protein kinase RIO [Candidatus Woesearchaeota archaeon]|nr:serine protein kinase RIO [Candidatus Woesearchaeota archaeon]
MTTRTSQERFKTAEGVFDEFTHRNLFELQSRNIFDELLSPIKVGKESNVFLASKGNKKVIVKIYRVQNCDFKRMYEYIGKDPRYEYLLQRRREIVFAWCQREYKNLRKAQEAGINVPHPLGWKSHILIETLIGDDVPAAQLKDALPKNPKEFFDLIVDQMKKLYQAGLIHGDLSAFNILNWNEKPYLIDFSQATVVKTPNSDELLERDIKNILHFFAKLKIKGDFNTIKEQIMGGSP